METMKKCKWCAGMVDPALGYCNLFYHDSRLIPTGGLEFSEDSFLLQRDRHYDYDARTTVPRNPPHEASAIHGQEVGQG